MHPPDRGLRLALERVTGKPGRSRRIANRLEPKLEVVEPDDSIANWVRASLQDPAFVEMAAGTILGYYAPGVSTAGLRFDPVDAADNRIRIDTNADFNAVTAEYQATNPGTDVVINAPHVLADMMRVSEELFFAGLLGCDAATDPLTADLSGAQALALIKRHQAAAASLDHLLATVAANGVVSISELVNSGQKSIADVIELMEHGEPFRKWLQDREPTEDVVRAYVLAQTEQRWTGRLPIRVARFGFFTGVGTLVSGPAGVATAAGDAFLIDRLLRGWRPANFVNGPLDRFGH
jgi:hypothetical protein